MKDKVQILFIPFITSLIGLLIGYTFLNWLIFIKFELVSLKEIIIEFAIPAVLTGVITWFIIRPKLKILNLKAKRGNWSDFYSFILWIGLTIPLIISQKYIATATGELKEVYSVKDVYNSDYSKYYKFRKFYIDKRRIGIHNSFEASGKYNDRFNMYIHLVLPIFENARDTLNQVPLGWYGVKYHKQISNRLEPEEKESEYKIFANNSQTKFDRLDVTKFRYLEKIGNNNDKDRYIDAVKEHPSYPPVETIFIGINEPFEERNGNKLEWIFGSSLIISLAWFIMILIPKFDDKQLKRIKSGKPDKNALQERKEFYDFLKPNDNYFATPILIYLNAGVYILMVLLGLGFISFSGSDLLNYGANYGPLIREGQIWRLLSNIFLHGGFMHLLANMYGLLFVGIFLEPLLGRTKYFILYIVTGILASISSIWWYDATVSVGASGAIFGLYGFFIASMVIKVFPSDFNKNFLVSILVFVGFNLLMGLTGGIDNAAHIGGIISGFILGIIYLSFQLQSRNDKK